jgi:hypothetical protein
LKKLFRMPEQNLASALDDGAASLPFAQQAAGCEERDVGRICQLLIGNI